MEADGFQNISVCFEYCDNGKKKVHFNVGDITPVNPLSKI
jgi:hypothetical protein